jgi:hypothetical protein
MGSFMENMAKSPLNGDFGLTGKMLFKDKGAKDPNPLLTEALQTISNYNELAPYQLDSINTFGPQFAEAYGNTLAATYKGTLGAYENQISPTLSRVNSAQRLADINDVSMYGNLSRQAILDSNPDQARLLEMLNAQAQQGLAAGSQLTPEEQRQMQQASRSAFAARGMGNSNQSVMDEMMRQYSVGQDRMAQRRGFAGNVLGFNQAVVGDPFQQILGRSGQAIGAANSLAAQGQGQVSQSGGGNLYDPFRDAYSTMFHNQDIAAANDAANKQMTGQIIGGALGAAGNIGGGFAKACWAAREVFGAENPKWLQFREWLLEDAPRKLRQWYIANGEELAAALKANPEEKGWVREFMESKIRESNLGLT